MTEFNDPNSNEMYVDLRVHFTEELNEDGEGGGTSYLTANRISREGLTNITDDDLEGLEDMFAELTDTPVSDSLAETICYGDDLTLS